MQGFSFSNWYFGAFCNTYSNSYFRPNKLRISTNKYKQVQTAYQLNICCSLMHLEQAILKLSDGKDNLKKICDICDQESEGKL